MQRARKGGIDYLQILANRFSIFVRGVIDICHLSMRTLEIPIRAFSPADPLDLRSGKARENVGLNCASDDYNDGCRGGWRPHPHGLTMRH
jgi:hypothetical protein